MQGESNPSETPTGNDRKMQDSTTIITDGIYFIHPEGCGWVAVKYRGGRIVSRTEESIAATHAAAGDKWAGVTPSDDNREIEDEQLHAKIVADAMGEDAVAEMHFIAAK